MKQRMIQKMITQMIEPIVFADQVVRFFTEFDAAFAQYGELSSPITLSGDYEQHRLVYFKGAVISLWGANGNDNNGCIINADGSVTLRTGDATTLTAAAGTVPLNKLSLIKVKRTGSTGSIQANTDTPTTGAVGSGATTYDYIWRSNLDYTTGIGSDSKTWKDGDSTTGTLIYDSKFDTDNTTDVVVNEAAVLGSELYSFSNMGAFGSGVLTEEATGFSFDGTLDIPQDSERCYLNLITEVGKEYIVRYKKESAGGVGTGSVFARASLGGVGAILKTSSFDSGVIIFTATSTESSLLFDGNTGVEVYEFSGLSAVSISQPYTTLINSPVREEWVFDGSVSPNTWTDVATGTKVIEVAGT